MGCDLPKFYKGRRRREDNSSAAAGPVLNGQLPALGHRGMTSLSPSRGPCLTSLAALGPSGHPLVSYGFLSLTCLHSTSTPASLSPDSFVVPSILILSPRLALTLLPYASLHPSESLPTTPPHLGLFPFSSYSASFWLSLCDLHSSFLSCSFHRNLQQGGGGRDRKQTHPLPLCADFFPSLSGGFGGIFSAHTLGQPQAFEDGLMDVRTHTYAHDYKVTNHLCLGTHHHHTAPQAPPH